MPWFCRRQSILRPAPAGKLALCAFLVVFAIIVVSSYKTHISGAVLHSSELYRSIIKWQRLATGVDTAFLGDQRVMHEWIAHHRSDSSTTSLLRQRQSNKRGIVVPAGGSNQLANAFVNLYILRHQLHCRLPVTISYWGSSSREHIDAKTIDFFKQHIPDIAFVDLSLLPYPAHHRWLAPPDPHARLNGFKVKIFALYAAPYDHVLLMDSDSMALIDPTTLFDSPQYKQHGSMMWPDRWCTPVELFKSLGMDDGNGGTPQADSGQLLLDRARHASVLDWLLFLNTHDEFTYRHAHGDKDTFRAAFYLAGKIEDYYQVDQPLSVAMSRGVLYPHARGFIQHHPNGSLGFVHRTSQAKYEAHTSSNRAFNLVLLQPNCHWSERYWHFFTPMASLRGRHVAKTGHCDVSMYDPRRITGRKCSAMSLIASSSSSISTGSSSSISTGSGSSSSSSSSLTSSHPIVLEVPETSYVAKAQMAADVAHELFRQHVEDSPFLYPSQGGGGAGAFLVFIMCFSMVGGVLGGAAWWQRRRATSPLASTSSNVVSFFSNNKVLDKV